MPRLRSRLGTRLVAAVAGTALLAGSVVGSVAVLQARAALREDILTSSLASAELAADQTLNYATDSAQGYFLGRPAPADEFATLQSREAPAAAA